MFLGGLPPPSGSGLSGRRRVTRLPPPRAVWAVGGGWSCVPRPRYSACAPRGQDAPRSEGPRRVGERALDRAGLTRRAAAVSRGRRGFATQPRPRETERDRSPGWIRSPLAGQVPSTFRQTAKIGAVRAVSQRAGGRGRFVRFIHLRACTFLHSFRRTQHALSGLLAGWAGPGPCVRPLAVRPRMCCSCSACACAACVCSRLWPRHVLCSRCVPVRRSCAS